MLLHYELVDATPNCPAVELPEKIRAGEPALKATHIQGAL